MLAALSIGFSQLTSRSEMVRRHVAPDTGLHASVASVWTLAAALALPIEVATVLGILIMVHMLVWSSRRAASHPYRIIFSAAARQVAILAAAGFGEINGARDGLSRGTLTATGTAVVIGAAAVFAAVNLGVVLAGVYCATQPARLRDILPSADNVTFELGTIVAALFVAAALDNMVWLTPTVIVLLLAEQRATSVDQLRAAASTDFKTGLLSPATWRERASGELERIGRGGPAVLLMVDLDHFKLVNDTRGHLIGDCVLHAVAECIRSELRAYDLPGREGGEEFAVLLPDVGRGEGLLVAERIRARIELSVMDGVHLTASIGAATYPADGADLAALMASADAALYVAKDAGRNQVADWRADGRALSRHIAS